MTRLFFTRFRRPLGPRGIQHLVQKHLREAGIAGASVHSLRHTFGTHMVRKGAHLEAPPQKRPGLLRPPQADAYSILPFGRAS